MRIVLDTNVLVSGVLSPAGPPAQILQLIIVGRLAVLYDARILSEYREVLSRDHFGFDAGFICDLLDLIESEGDEITASPLPVRLPDVDDVIFLEVAVAGEADYLVTGNLRHFPATHRRGVSVLTPAEFVEVLKQHG